MVDYPEDTVVKELVHQGDDEAQIGVLLAVAAGK